jgi:hypothetical protein
LRGGSERLNGKGLNESNTFFICDTDERGSGIKEKCSLNGRKMLLAHLRASRPAASARVGGMELASHYSTAKMTSARIKMNG